MTDRRREAARWFWFDSGKGVIDLNRVVKITRHANVAGATTWLAFDGAEGGYVTLHGEDADRAILALTEREPTGYVGGNCKVCGQHDGEHTPRWSPPRTSRTP